MTSLELNLDGLVRMRQQPLTPHRLAPKEACAWRESLRAAVDELAQRYPRSFGMTIPSGWHEDAESSELLALITKWRAALDECDAERIDQFPEGEIEHARSAWEWHARRGEWLVRLAETGCRPAFAFETGPASCEVPR